MKAHLLLTVWSQLGYRASAAACSSLHLSAPTTVSDTAGALLLAEAVNCSGGSFAVEWVGSVRVTKPITVSDDTVLEVSGATGGSSVMNGGGQNSLFDVSYDGHLKISELTLVNGTGDLGGALSVVYAVLQVNQCSFVGNAADAGGAIFVHHSRVHLTNNVSFSGNSAVYNGGGIYAFDNSSVIVVGDLKMEANVAQNGGSISMELDCHLNVTGRVAFTNDLAQIAGGGLYLNHSSATILDLLTVEPDSTGNAAVIFARNTAAIGGAVHVIHASVHVESDVSFVDNVALQFGGGIFGFECSFVVMGNAEWKTNEARYGGGVYLFRSNLFSATGKVVFANNVAEDGGGLILTKYSTMTTPPLTPYASWTGEANCGFCGNRATVSFGGAVIVHDGSDLHVRGNVEFTNNSAFDSGGAIFASNKSLINVAGTATYDSNYARFGGGAYITFDSDLSVSGDITFINNVANETGGGMHLSDGSKMLCSSNLGLDSRRGATCHVVDNKAKFGGGIFAENSIIQLTSNASFARNSVNRWGGSICAIDSSSIIVAGNAEWLQNQADIGGGIFVGGDSLLSLSGLVKFLNNSATGGGALALSLAASVTTLGNISMSGNSVA